MAASRRRTIARLTAVAAALLAVGVAAAPMPAQAPEPRSIEGRVVRPAGQDVAGVSGAWVVLHRVGRDAAGPLDSMRTRRDGSYGFRYLATGDTNAVYFVSTSRGGVNYFTPPAREPIVRGGVAELMVYDTTSAPIPITVRGRHVVVTAPDSASGRTRSIIEVYELSNDGDRTRVAAGTDGVTFDAPLPPGVTQVVGGEGDISPDAIRVFDGRVLVTAAIAPGPKQFSFVYELPVSAEEMPFAVESAVPVIEVLVEDPRGRVDGAGLIEMDPVQVEGRPFRRYLAQEARAGSVIHVLAPGPEPTRVNVRLLLIVTAVGAALLLGFGMAVMRRGPGALARRRTDDPETLAAEIAALDAVFERLAAPTEPQRAEHYLARARLKGRLTEVLAKRDGLR